MKGLLEKDFIDHYNRFPDRPVEKNEINIDHSCTDEVRFELKDKANKKDSAGNDMYGIV
ncbi:MAG: hypothetical protein LBL58_05800 [Tannerellaceae bacterium]|jgi:hypothetical protein|nr:hypothetical protein [Tannerellaceae bacterium]